MQRLSALGTFALACSTLVAQQYTITTIAGTGTAGTSGNNGPAVAAMVNYPQGLALDAAGDLFFTQYGDHVVRKIGLVDLVIEHVAGIGVTGYEGNGGPALYAGLNAPNDLAFDAAGDLYISEPGSFRIRRIAAGDGVISTFAGTMSPGNNVEVPALSANLSGPRGLAFTLDGDLLISLLGNECVRAIDADTNYLHAFAGTGAMGSTGFSGDGGPALAAQFYAPYGVEVAPNGNVLVADLNNHRIRKIDHASGTITTVAGSGGLQFNGDGIPAINAAIGTPQCMAFDADGNLFFTDLQLNRVRRVDAISGLITTIAGTGTPGFSGDGGPATSAAINTPAGIAVGADGRIYFADGYNHRIRMLTPMDDTSVGEVSPLANMSAYPIPAKDVLHIRSDVRGRVELLDVQGRVVRNAQLNSSTTAIGLDGVVAGLYTVRLAGAVPVRVVVE